MIDKKVKKLIVMLLIFILIDVFIFSWLLAFLYIYWLIFIWFFSIFFSKDKAERIYKIKRFILWILTVVLIINLNNVNLKIADNRFIEIISAVNNYKSQTWSYPKKLNELVPKYLSSIKPAWYRLFWIWTYASTDKFHELNYIVIPPFFRKFHHFEDNKTFEWD